MPAVVTRAQLAPLFSSSPVSPGSAIWDAPLSPWMRRPETLAGGLSVLASEVEVRWERNLVVPLEQTLLMSEDDVDWFLEEIKKFRADQEAPSGSRFFSAALCRSLALVHGPARRLSLLEYRFIEVLKELQSLPMSSGQVEESAVSITDSFFCIELIRPCQPYKAEDGKTVVVEETRISDLILMAEVPCWWAPYLPHLEDMRRLKSTFKASPDTSMAGTTKKDEVEPVRVESIVELDDSDEEPEKKCRRVGEQLSKEVEARSADDGVVVESTVREDVPLLSPPPNNTVAEGLKGSPSIVEEEVYHQEGGRPIDGEVHPLAVESTLATSAAEVLEERAQTVSMEDTLVPRALDRGPDDVRGRRLDSAAEVPRPPSTTVPPSPFGAYVSDLPAKPPLPSSSRGTEHPSTPGVGSAAVPSKKYPPSSSRPTVPLSAPGVRSSDVSAKKPLPSSSRPTAPPSTPGVRSTDALPKKSPPSSSRPSVPPSTPGVRSTDALPKKPPASSSRPSVPPSTPGVRSTDALPKKPPASSSRPSVPPSTPGVRSTDALPKRSPPSSSRPSVPTSTPGARSTDALPKRSPASSSRPSVPTSTPGARSTDVPGKKPPPPPSMPSIAPLTTVERGNNSGAPCRSPIHVSEWDGQDARTLGASPIRPTTATTPSPTSDPPMVNAIPPSTSWVPAAPHPVPFGPSGNPPPTAPHAITAALYQAMARPKSSPLTEDDRVRATGTSTPSARKRKRSQRRAQAGARQRRAEEGLRGKGRTPSSAPSQRSGPRPSPHGTAPPSSTWSGQSGTSPTRLGRPQAVPVSASQRPFRYTYQSPAISNSGLQLRMGPTGNFNDIAPPRLYSEPPRPTPTAFRPKQELPAAPSTSRVRIPQDGAKIEVPCEFIPYKNPS